MADIRKQTVDANKKYKGSWLTLSYLLNDVKEGEYYSEWGFENFEAYIKDELGLTTSLVKNMINAFKFIAKTQPNAVAAVKKGEVAPVPEFCTVNALVKAKDKNIITEEKAKEVQDFIFENPLKTKESNKVIKSGLSEKEVVEDINKEIKEVKKLSFKLNDKLHNTSAFDDEVIKLSDELKIKVDAVAGFTPEGE
mgnify:FL=1